jgi:hypothetical protein
LGSLAKALEAVADGLQMFEVVFRALPLGKGYVQNTHLFEDSSQTVALRGPNRVQCLLFSVKIFYDEIW